MFRAFGPTLKKKNGCNPLGCYGKAFGVVSANGSDGTAINGEQAFHYETEVTTFLLHTTKKFNSRLIFSARVEFLPTHRVGRINNVENGSCKAYPLCAMIAVLLPPKKIQAWPQQNSSSIAMARCAWKAILKLWTATETFMDSAAAKR